VEITEVRVFLKDSEDKKLKAYVTITLDQSFVVRDLKVIDGNKGLFVAMPSRKAKDGCPRCRHKNVVRSRYCNQCGHKLEEKEHVDQDFQADHRDIAHPITVEAREYIQGKVLAAYEEEKLQAEIAIRISAERTKQNLTQIELAKRAHTTQSVIARLENISYPSCTIKTLQKIGNALGKRVNISFG